MSGTATHFLHGGIDLFLDSFRLYLAGAAVLLCLGIILFMASKRKNRKKKTAKPASPTPRAAPPDTVIQPILQALSSKNDQSRPLLLAASRLRDLPVTIPINLAIQLAGQGPCLLIDLDNKRDALAKVFDVDTSKINTHIRGIPIQTPFENLSIWPARYFDLLKQTNLQLLLNAAGKKYDHILLYAPYLTVLADRKQIAYCSRQAVVFGGQRNPQTQKQLHKLLSVCNCKILHEA